MYQLQEFAKLLCLLLLAGRIANGVADEFPQCLNVDVDTFIMAVDDCSSYIYCNGENSFRDSCPNQTYFDAKAQECAFDDAGVCLQPLEAVSPIEPIVAVEEEDLQIVATTFAPVVSSPETDEKPLTPAGNRPHCDTEGDGYHPHPQRCEYYYRCFGGFLTIVRCPYNFGWDYAQAQCRPLSEAQCFRL